MTNRSDLQTALLTWFVANARDLPWRRTRDPYRIMVSEIMLQQTQVDRVLPRYEAFLEQFPTLEALANAPTADVIRAWAGMGYNRRAVNMQRAARMVLEQSGGIFPRDPAELRRLPGIGPYTAGAIACFAFEQDVAFLDTNIRRVIERLLTDPGTVSSERQLTDLAAELVPVGQGWAWNQAIMELGALICTASNPRCRQCPLREHCHDYAARLHADQQLLQFPTPRKRVAEKRETPFAGSTRYFRGRLLAALRDLPPGTRIPIDELCARAATDAPPDMAARLPHLVHNMARDGLIQLTDGFAHLPE